MSILLAQADDGSGGVSVAEFENMFWLFAVAGNETPARCVRARPAGDQGAPEVATVLVVLDVNVDLDIGAGDLDAGDPTAPVDHRVAEDGAGLVDLPRQAAQPRIPGRARAQSPGVTEQEESGVVQLLELAPLPFADDVAQRGAGRLMTQGVHDRGEVNFGGY